MKKFVLIVAIAGNLASGHAFAACDAGSRLAAPAIRTLLGNNTVCVPTATIPNMTWQELHDGVSGGAIIDYKRGPGHAVDPSKTVGAWSVSGTLTTDSFVTHAYSGGGGTYSYSVHTISGTNYSFCPIGGGVEIVARVQLGGGAC